MPRGGQQRNISSTAQTASRELHMIIDIPFPTPTVFIVDSDAAGREPLAALIRGAGWQPRFAASAEEFLAQPRTWMPCCLLVELCLPGMSGLDLQRLVADRVEMPAIFMSRQADIP